MAKEAPYIGKMNRQIKVFKSERIPDELSDHKETLVKVSEPWAAMDDVSGSQEIDGSVINVVNRSYTIRRNPEIAKHGRSMTIEDNTVLFTVYDMKEIGRTHLMLYVTANE